MEIREVGRVSHEMGLHSSLSGYYRLWNTLIRGGPLTRGDIAGDSGDKRGGIDFLVSGTVSQVYLRHLLSFLHPCLLRPLSLPERAGKEVSSGGYLVGTSVHRGGTGSHSGELYPLSQVFVQLCGLLLLVVSGEVVPESGERLQVCRGYCGKLGDVVLTDA